MMHPAGHVEFQRGRFHVSEVVGGNGGGRGGVGNRDGRGGAEGVSKTASKVVAESAGAVRVEQAAGKVADGGSTQAAIPAALPRSLAAPALAVPAALPRSLASSVSSPSLLPPRGPSRRHDGAAKEPASPEALSFPKLPFSEAGELVVGSSTPPGAVQAVQAVQSTEAQHLAGSSLATKADQQKQQLRSDDGGGSLTPAVAVLAVQPVAQCSEGAGGGDGSSPTVVSAFGGVVAQPAADSGTADTYAVSGAVQSADSKGVDVYNVTALAAAAPLPRGKGPG